jgi:ankyrin repeat protein
MIRDDDGDLPLHFACCNGAPPSLLRAMTTSSLGDPASATVRNFKNRLAVDDYIEWYVDEMNDERRIDREGSDEVSEGWDEGVYDAEVEIDPDSADDADSNSDTDADCDPNNMSDSFLLPSSNRALVNSLRHFPRDAMKIFSASCGETDFRAAMYVLIHAAAMAVRNTTLHYEEQAHTESKNNVPNSSLLPIHDAVIATKYSNFPAIALAACIRWRMNDVHNEYREDNLLEEDSYGYLPLHWACGDISRLMAASGVVSSDASLRHNWSCCMPYTTSGYNPSTKQCGALARFNTMDIPCSSIEYLLECDPTAASAPTRCGSLPLHLLVADANLSADVHIPFYKTNGGSDAFCRRQPWDDIKLLLKQYPEALGTPGAKSRLYPFQVAAESSTSQSHGLVSLENTYRLIMEDPSILCQLLDNNRKKM